MRALDDGKQRDAEQRVLQPDDETVMHQIKAVGVGERLLRVRERLTPKRRLAAMHEKAAAAQASTKPKSAAMSMTIGAGPFMVKAVTPIQANSVPSATASQSFQRRPSGPSEETRPTSMPPVPIPTPAKK